MDLKADLVLEGGGVKGIGLVGAVSVLAKKGYVFPRVAGTSAGAIVGALVAAGIPHAELKAIMESVEYKRFQDEGFLDKIPLIGKGASLFFEKGIYEGNYLKTWLTEQLAKHGVETFADLRIPDDRASSLPPEKRYKLVVMTADLSRGSLVRLPWDYRSRYGLDPDKQLVADAVRASMSIPFFYEPVKLRNSKTRVESFLVDGGLLSNFPVDVFDRTDGRPPRWPTFGLKLSARPEANQVPNKITDTFSFAKAMVGTMVSGHDQMYIDDESVQARTVFVDTFNVRATDFGLSQVTARKLYMSGVRQAKRFLENWDFERYVKEWRGEYARPKKKKR
jgi:NTE family protein